MTDYLSPYHHLMWERGQAKIKSFATTSRAKGTAVTIVLEVSGGSTLSDIRRQCHDVQAEDRKPKAPDKPKAPANPKRGTDLKALPAPPLGLPYFGDEG